MEEREAREYQQAVRRGKAKRRTQPYAVSARYESRIDRLLVSLNTGMELAFAPGAVEVLRDASAVELQEVEVTPSGYELFFPHLEQGVYLPGLIQGVYGTKSWQAGNQPSPPSSKMPTPRSRKAVA